MKTNFTKAIVGLLLTLSVNNLIAQTPWKCDGRAIGTYNPGSNSYTDDTKLYSAVFDDHGNVVYVDKPATAAIGLNAIGFRKQDGFVYGVRYTKGNSKPNELCRIDSTGLIQSLGNIKGLKENLQYFAGGFDINGDLYVSSGSGAAPYELYKIDVTNVSATDLGTISYRLVDMAFDPLTNELYATSVNALNDAGNLLKINTATNPATVTDLGSMNVFMFGLFFSGNAQLYGFGRLSSDNSTAYYKISKTDGTLVRAGAGPLATNADACSCPFRLSHTLEGKSGCITVGEQSSLTVTITNITSNTQNASFDLTMDKRFIFVESASQIQANIQSLFPGSTAMVTLSDANGGIKNVISINTIAVPSTKSVETAIALKLLIRLKTSSPTASDIALFQSVINVPGNTLNLGADNSDDPLTAQLNDATILTICPVTPVEGTTPVTLTDFRGQVNQKTANLNWATAQEVNTKSYELERSFNGISFTALNTVSAKNIAGGNYYQYSDISVPANSVVYYRLKMVDNNGSFKYSSVVVLKTTNEEQQTAVFPAPFTDRVMVNTTIATKGRITIALTDGIGRKIAEKTTNVEAGNNTITLMGLEKVQTGFYYVRIYSDNKLIETQKTLKL